MWNFHLRRSSDFLKNRSCDLLEKRSLPDPGRMISRALLQEIKACFRGNEDVPLKPSEKTDPEGMRTELLKWLSRLAPAGYLSLALDGMEDHTRLVSAQSRISIGMELLKRI